MKEFRGLSCGVFKHTAKAHTEKDYFDLNYNDCQKNLIIKKILIANSHKMNLMILC